MKKTVLFLVAATLFVMSGCSKYDDSHLQERMETLEKTVLALQQTIDRINSDMAAVKGVTDAFASGDLISGIEEIKENGVVVGYRISFVKSSPITIYNGTESIVGVKEDSDGVLYWTLNGEWLLHDGEKIPASGNGGIVPKIRINEGNFEISFDGGASWEIIGPASNGEVGGDCIFSHVEVTDDAVIFTLSDGEKRFTIPFEKPFVLVIETTTYAVEAGQTLSIAYSVEGATEATTVDCIALGSYQAVVKATSHEAGEIEVTVPETFAEGKVMVYADSKSGKTSIVTLYFTGENTEEPPVANYIFADTFDWSIGTASTPGGTGGEVGWTNLSGATNGWESELVNGNHNVWSRAGCVRFSRTGYGGILVSPKLEKIEGTADVTVTFKAARWNGSGEGKEDPNYTFYIQIRNAGTASQTLFPITNMDLNKDVQGTWQEDTDCTYTFDITGATAETQIAFISADNPEAIISGAGRLLLDDVFVSLK